MSLRSIFVIYFCYILVFISIAWAQNVKDEPKITPPALTCTEGSPEVTTELRLENEIWKMRWICVKGGYKIVHMDIIEK